MRGFLEVLATEELALAGRKTNADEETGSSGLTSAAFRHALSLKMLRIAAIGAGVEELAWGIHPRGFSSWF